MAGSLSTNEITVGLATIVSVGVAAQWVARRLELPSILLLLPAGIAAGELGLVDPHALFGDTLFPLVTLLVALLLFQAALQLRIAELPPAARGPVARLVAIGGTVTFLGATLAVAALFDMDASDAFLTGAILVVSGPTVVGPLVRVMRPRAPIGPVLNWESTVLDPLGAVLGVVVLNIVVASARGELHPALQLGERLGVGVVIGAVAAVLLVLVLSRFLVTDDMEAAVALMFAVAAYAVAEVLVSEAGLLAAVVLGVVVANQQRVPTARISGFGETLEVLIIGILFMVLGALVPVDDLLDNLGRIAALVAVLVLVVRPVGVSLALARTGLSRSERILIGGVDPRGIVAAATAAQFSGVLADDGLSNHLLLPVVFGVILGAGVVYGIGAPLLARLLGVIAPRPTGVCLIGDEPWVRDLSRQLHARGLPVLRLTTGPPGDALEAARTEQIATISVHDSLERVEHAIADAPLALAIVAAPPAGAVGLLEARLIEDLGRRHVARAGGTGGRHPRVLIRADGSVHLVARRDRRTAHGDTVVASSL